MNTTDFKSKYNNSSTGLFKDNSNGDIEAVDTRSLVVDVGDNFVNKETDGFYAMATTSGLNSYGVTVTPVPSGYVHGHRFTLKFDTASTGSATLNLNALGPRKIFKNPTTQAGSGDIIQNQIYNLAFDLALDSPNGAFAIIGASAAGGGGGTQDLESVLTEGNDAGAVAITNLADPTNPQDAATKNYVDTQVGSAQDLEDVLTLDNDAGGIVISNIGTPVSGSDAATKDYADSVSDSGNLADYVTLTDAAPVEVDCNSLKEPKFYLETGTSRTLNITEFRANSVLNNYSTILFIIKKTVAGDITITLDTDYTNKDFETPNTTVTSFVLSGADESYFKITGVARGEASGCIIWWNLAQESTGGGGGSVSDWGDIGGTLSDQTDLQAALDAKQAALVSGTNIKTIAGASIVGSGNVSTLAADLSMGTHKLTNLSAASANGDAVRWEQVVGVEDLPVPATAMWPRVTAGCAVLAQTEVATSLINILTLDFDATTQEYAQFSIGMPRKWNLGTVTFAVEWVPPTGTGSVVWALSGVALADNDALTTTFGTAVVVVDAAGTASTLRKTATSSAVTIANTPASGDTVYFQVSRVATDGSDTMVGDAKLHRVFIYVTTSSPLDA